MKIGKRFLSIVMAFIIMLAAIPFAAGATNDFIFPNQRGTGDGFSSFLKEDGTVWSWGRNGWGELGNGNLVDSPAMNMVLDDVKQLESNLNTTVAVKNDGSLWIWGVDSYILEQTLSEPTKVMENVREATCNFSGGAAIKEDNTLWVWGDYKEIGEKPPVYFMSDVKSIASSNGNYAAIKTDDSLWVWGFNEYGTIGNGERKGIISGAVKDSDFTTEPYKVLDNVVYASCGDVAMTALKSDGSLWMWGTNYYNSFLNPTINEALRPVKVMENLRYAGVFSQAIYVIKNDNSLWGWGGGSFGDGYISKSLREPIKIMDNVDFIAAGGEHSVVQKLDGSVWAWGHNEYGEVGDGTTVNKLYPVEIMRGNAYEVRFLDYDGEVLKTELVTIGGSATAPSIPRRTGHTFKAWDTDFSNVNSNLTVTATYTQNEYTVIFTDYDDTVLKTCHVKHGSPAIAPPNPIREGFVFERWNTVFSSVTGDLTVKATYKANPDNYYSVVFTDDDGTVLSTQSVRAGSNAIAPADPVKTGYVFRGWDKGFTAIGSNLTVTAVYDVAPGFEVIETSGDYNRSNIYISDNLIIKANNVTIYNFSMAGNLIVYGSNVTVYNMSISGNVTLSGQNVIIRDGSIAGTLSIGAANTTVQRVIVNGDITIEKTVEDGEVRLENVTASSSTVYVKAGGSNSVIVKDSKIAEAVIDKESNSGSQVVRIATEGDTEIGTTQVLSEAIIDNTKGDSGAATGTVEVLSGVDSNVILRGDFENISLPSKSLLEFDEASVETMNIGAEAADTKIYGTGLLDSVKVDGTIAGTEKIVPVVNEKRRTHMVKVVASANGSVTPDTDIVYDEGEKEISYKIMPDTGYEIYVFKVNGVSTDKTENYIIRNIMQAYNIEVKFALEGTPPPTDDPPVTLPGENTDEVTEEEELEEINHPFTDIDNHWGKAQMLWVYENGLFEGISKTKFSPNTKMNRGMLAVVLWRLAGKPAPLSGFEFSDVAAGQYYTEAVKWAAEKSIVNGISDGVFSPAGSIKREQLVTMLHRYAGKPVGAGDLSVFTDADSISAYALDAMKWAVGEGIITGKTKTALIPAGEATRAEVAAMVKRFSDLQFE